MTRPIKFRAWDKNGKAFVYLRHLYNEWWYNEDGEAAIANDNDNAKQLEPQQFTGLTDKNGKEIYEGDIVEYPLPNTPRIPMVVEFRTYEGAFVMKTAAGSTTQMMEPLVKSYEIIGNIHENPELVK